MMAVSGFNLFGGGIAIKSRQSGLVDMGSKITLDINIDEVNLGNSIVIIQNDFAENNNNAGDLSRFKVMGVLENSNTIRLTRKSASVALSIRWEVIEFESVKSKQTGILKPSGAISNITIDNVDPTKCFTFVSDFYERESVIDASIYHVFSKVESQDTLRISVSPTYLNRTYAWQVVEFE